MIHLLSLFDFLQDYSSQAKQIILRFMVNYLHFLILRINKEEQTKFIKINKLISNSQYKTGNYSLYRRDLHEDD